MRHRRKDSGPKQARKVIEDALITGASLLVLVVGALYVFAPPKAIWAMDVTSEAISGDTAVLYGSVVDATGKPVRGATVVVVREEGSETVQVASLRPAATGTWRTELGAPFGWHRVIVSADIGSTTARDTTRIDVQGGHAYGVTAELTERSYFVFLPIPTY